MMSETLNIIEINLLTQTVVIIKTHLQRILTVTLDINHSTKPRGVFLSYTYMKFSNNLLIQTGVITLKLILVQP